MDSCEANSSGFARTWRSSHGSDRQPTGAPCRQHESLVSKRVRQFRPVDRLNSFSARTAGAARACPGIEDFHMAARHPVPCGTHAESPHGLSPATPRADGSRRSGHAMASAHRIECTGQGADVSSSGPSTAGRRSHAAATRRSMGAPPLRGGPPAPPGASRPASPPPSVCGHDGHVAVSACCLTHSVRHPRRRDTREERNADQCPPAGGKPDCHH